VPDSQIKENEAVARSHQAILDKLSAVPGVTSVALASTVTMTGQGWHDPLYARDRTYTESQIPPLRLFKIVSPGYMKTLGTPLVAGRDFTWTDIYDLRPVAMVSENLARELWGQPAAAIGKWIRPYAKGTWREVVGVVGDMRDNGLNEKAATVAYWPLMMEAFLPATRTARPSCFAVRHSWCAAHAPARPGSSTSWGGRCGRSTPTCRWPASAPSRRFTTRRWPGRRSRW
jgi:hypothetical protein